ncbi:MAG: hypothetical protein LBK08_05355 [Treponema sp.]|jgi:xylulokinase|nr:hypothetical protein [Treponema sp.]
MDHVIGIDIGTTAVKVIIAGGNAAAARAGSEYGLLLPKPGWVEQDADLMWQAVRSALNKALAQFKGDRRGIRAISLSTQRDTLVCVDRENRPVRNMITWMDGRSTAQCEKLSAGIGDEKVYGITGVGISTIWTLAFILWIRDHEKDVFSRTACFGLVHDHVMMRLGAKKHYLDRSSACQTMLYDLFQGVWSFELMEYAGLDAERLPDLVDPGTFIGTLDPSLAAEFGLGKEVALIAGGGDQQCAALGAGAVMPGEVEIGIGTAGNILAVTDVPVLDPHRRMICHRSVVPNGWILEGAMLATGKVIQWIQDTIYSGKSLPEIDREIAEKSLPGAGGMVMVPHFEGAACPYWNPQATGVVFGLTLSSGKADIARAAMEGICLETRKNVDLLPQFGITASRVLVSGGAARSAVWMQILADVLGLDVHIPVESDCAALGAALLAAFGCSVMTQEEAFSGGIAVDAVYHPDAKLHGLYESLYRKNCDLYQTINSAGLYGGGA